MSTAFPKEPSGSNVLKDWPFNSLQGSGAGNMWDVYGSASIISDATAPLSPNNVMQSILYAGASNGGSQVEYNAPGGPYNDVFVGLWFRNNTDFVGWNRVANKMFFVKGPQTNGFFGIHLIGTGPYTIYFGHNTSGLDNSHIWQADLGLIGNPNIANPSIQPGAWVKMEIYIKFSTSATSRNGIVRWWINDTLCGSWDTVNYPGGFTQWIWTETLGNQNQILSTDRAFYIDQVYISTGGTAPTPDPTPEPPPPPPPVVLQSLTPSNQSTVVGTTKQFTISMSGPVQTATSLFTTSSNPSVATVPASVTISAGTSTALVTATPVAVGSTTISTSYNGVTKGATLQVGSSGSTTGSTAYDYSLQFSGTQGSNNWYYLENTGTQMTYSGGVWTGTDTFGGNLQTIWDTGFHPGGLRATVLRFVVPTTGSATIAGSFVDLDTGGGTGCVARVNHNGVTLFTRTIANGDTTGGTYNLTASVAAGDQIDFVVANLSADYSYNSTSLNPVITLSATSTPPAPTPDPEVQAAIVDLFAASTTHTAGVAFTMTVRLSKVVTVDTSVEIRVGSVSLLTAPTSATVPSGSSEKTFTVTPLAAGTVAVDAILNGVKRVTLTIQAAAPETPPVIDPGPPTSPTESFQVRTIRAMSDGATVVLNQGAGALAFRYDAQPDFIVIPDYPVNATTYVHRFTWPSGTTTVCYRAQGVDGTWGPSACTALPTPEPPPVPPAVTKSIIDRAGVKWQLTGRRMPYELKRNGSTMDNTFGVTLRKSGDGYMEVLQPNGVWLRRNGDSWEYVA